MTTERTYMTTAQAAKYIGFAESTLEKLRCYGGGPTFLKPLGRRRVLYAREALDAWLQAGQRSSTSAEPEGAAA